MSKVIYLDELEKEVDFARKAAEFFAENPACTTFGTVKADSLFAVRWGLGNDCVLVFRLEDAEPRIYAQLIKRGQATVPSNGATPQ